jgi:hypothetical protein
MHCNMALLVNLSTPSVIWLNSLNLVQLVNPYLRCLLTILEAIPSNYSFETGPSRSTQGWNRAGLKKK